jgi:DNA (cytosine-5)-methyltransferase 3A
MRVLSLFDGISCARAALERANLPINTYYASEIDKNAIQVSTKNYPDIIHLGSVVGLTPPENIDLLIGGSPCTDLSIAKKERQGLEGSQSSLFWEYVRIKKECNPKWFVLENVASMAKKDRDIITKEMGVEPVLFNASLVSAQCRKRLFWTNIPFTLPEDRGILLKDILQPDAEVDEKMTIKNTTFTNTAQTGRNETKKLGYVGQIDHQAKRVYDEDGKCPALNVVCNSMVKLGHIGNTDSQGQRVYSPEGKGVTLSANGGGGGAKMGLYAIGRDIGRRLTEDGTRADHDTSIPYERRIETRTDDKCGTLTSVTKDNVVVSPDRIRKLTPIECERLQGLPDDYTSGVAMTQRYKCLGNAFNVDVVAHILRGLA